jgi:hypothetical protein
MDRRRGITLGVALVGVGLYALLSRSLGFRGPGPVLLLIGAIFFVLSALSRFGGPLLPACVLLGLGTGLLLRGPLEPWMPHWAAILLGIGSGFLLVAAIDRTFGRRRQPPPVVPGAVLAGIALAEAASRALSLENLFARLEPVWPYGVIAAGLFLTLTALRKRRT